MIMDHEITVAAPADRVWEFMLDIPSVARCVPGVQSIARAEGGAWTGALMAKAGPIIALLEGCVRLAEADNQTRQSRLDVEAAERRLQSVVNARTSVQLESLGDGSTRATMYTEASVFDPSRPRYRSPNWVT